MPGFRHTLKRLFSKILKSRRFKIIIRQRCSFRSFQRFILGLDKITCKIRDSLKLCTEALRLTEFEKLNWNATEVADFRKNLDLIAESIHLYYYHTAKNTQVKCHISHSGLGACLKQETDPGY